MFQSGKAALTVLCLICVNQQRSQQLDLHTARVHLAHVSACVLYILSSQY